MRYIIRDDIVKKDTFYEATKYRRFLQVIKEAGGYVFNSQIEKLWHTHGGKYLIKKLIDSGLIKTVKWNGFSYIYLTEASLKYLKYGHSEQNFDGIKKNTLGVKVLGEPTDSIIITSSLKFSILADAAYILVYNIDTHTESDQGISQYFMKKPVGKSGYEQSLDLCVKNYAKHGLSDLSTIKPVANKGEKNFNNGIWELAKPIYKKSNHQIYTDIVNRITPASLSLFDSAKIAILLRNRNDFYGNIDLDVTIFDSGIDKTARDYISEILRYIDRTRLFVKIVKINLYSYTEVRKNLIKGDFVQFLKGYPSNLNIKRKKQPDKVEVVKIRTDATFVLGDFRFDTIIQRVSNGKIIDPNKKVPLVEVSKLDKNQKRRQSVAEKLGVQEIEFTTLLNAEMVETFEDLMVKNKQDIQLMMEVIMLQYIKENSGETILKINEPVELPQEPVKLIIEPKVPKEEPTEKDLSELIPILLTARRKGHVKQVDFKQCIELDEFLKNKTKKQDEINKRLVDILKIIKKLELLNFLDQSEQKVMDRINTLVENVEPVVVANNIYSKVSSFCQNNLDPQKGDGAFEFEIEPRILVSNNNQQFLEPTTKFLCRRGEREVTFLIEILFGSDSFLHLLTKLTKYDEYYQQFPSGPRPVVVFLTEKEGTLLKIDEQICNYKSLKPFVRYTTEKKFLTGSVLGEAFYKVIDHKLEVAPFKMFSI